MTREDYKKLNDYLNECFKRLEKEHFFLLRNIVPIAQMSDLYIHAIKDYELKIEETPNANLTFEEVYLLSREIIKDINPMYLEKYDQLISSGKLDFSYNKEYFGSHYAHFKNGTEQINMNRKFDYRDVSSLVHEFMHLVNYSIKLSPTRETLTEFISIYFEEYAKQYLLKKGIAKEKLYPNERILFTKESASNFSCYSLILLIHEMIGNLDENSYLFLREYYLSITKEVFEEECKFLLDKINEIEDKYKLEIMYERKYDDNEVYDRCAALLKIDYQYVFGTPVAYYALDHIDKEKMVWLNEHINDDDQTVYDILCEIGIELDEISIIDLVKIVENKIDMDNTKKR